MDATHVHACSRLAVAALAWALFAAQALAAPPQATVPAVWKERKLSFTYSSATTHYSCRAIAARVASILRAVGARDDVRVHATGCSDTLMPSDAVFHERNPNVPGQTPEPLRRRRIDDTQMISVQAQAVVPTEATEAVLAELGKDKSRRELVSRVTGDPVAQFADSVTFAAQRQEVTLSRKTIGVEPEECELIEQITPALFREFDVRVVRGSRLCTAQSRIAPVMVVEALLAARLDDGTIRQAPTQGPATGTPGTTGQ